MSVVWCFSRKNPENLTNGINNLLFISISEGEFLALQNR